MPFAVYILYRFIIAGYFLGFLIYFILASKNSLGAKFLIFLTDWTFIEINLYFWVAFINVLIDLIHFPGTTVPYSGYSKGTSTCIKGDFQTIFRFSYLNVYKLITIDGNEV